TSSLPRGEEEEFRRQRVEPLSQGNSRPRQSQSHGSRPRRHVQVEVAGVSEATATAPTVLPVEESTEPGVQSEGRRYSILDDHAVIGLDFLVECRRQEDGRPCCFLCHCCRVKCNPDDVIDHLTSSSHISNYLVLEWPAHYCDQLADKTYHWCIKTFSSIETSTGVKRREKKTVGFKYSDASWRPPSQIDPASEVRSERAGKKRRAGDESDPVFK
ncbi:hypothetical protein CRUP_022154, partial [Coryphaenoides rupestris]